MFKTITIRTAVCLIVFMLCTSNTLAGPMLDYDTYISPWPNAIPGTLNGYDGVTGHPDALYSQPWGDVNWETGGGQLLAGTQLWIIANDDHQVVGEVDMDVPGGYSFSILGATGIYGDSVGTGGVDEGASPLEGLIVLAEVGGKYYQGYFKAGSDLASGYQWTSDRNDILITPEPATLALMAAGGAATVLLRRRREK